jgi:hypothetical protein
MGSDPVAPYIALAAHLAVRQRHWPAYAHQAPEEAVLAAQTAAAMRRACPLAKEAGQIAFAAK